MTFEEPDQSTESRDLWVCPKCGARLVTRNMWHSCGQFTLQSLFAKSDPAALVLAQRYVGMLADLGDVQIIPQKTRLVCVARVRFAGLTPRAHGFMASFALRQRLRNRRITRVTEYGRNWLAHEMRVDRDADLDDQLRSWLQESHDVVGMQASHLR